MSIIISNYENITRTIVSNIRNGNLISANSDKLEGLTTKELFNLFTQEFNLKFYTEKVTELYYDETTGALGIPFTNKVSHISKIYFNGVGDLELSDGLSLTLSSDNFLYFDLNTLNIPDKWISKYSIITLEYIGFEVSV